MKYVVIETVERTSYVIGKASDMHEAREMMKERFRKIFWEKFPNEAESKQSLEEVYETNLDESEFEFDEETAFINGVHGYDYDWKILDTSCEDVLENRFPSWKCWIVATPTFMWKAFMWKPML